MDDPWSSPWTTVDEDPSKRHPPEVPAAPPATAVAFPPSVRFDSLWGDDSFGGWGVTDTRISGDHGTLSSTHEPKTNGFEDRSDGFGAYTTGTGVTSAFSSLSPEADPWATEVSYSSFEDTKKADAQRGLSPVDELAVDHGHTETSDATHIALPEPPTLENGRFDAVENRTAAPEPNDSRPPSPETDLEDGPHDDVLSVPKHRDVSPDPQSESSRQVSKVQELVDMYDGIAKKATSAPPPAVPVPRKKATGSDNVETEDEEEDGIRKDGKEEKDGDEDEEDWPEDFETGDNEPAQILEPPSPHGPPSPQATREPPPKFDIDMSQMPTLFNNIAADPSTTVPAQLPDHPDLNFSTVTERKAWYRLSRQGSSRLHDFGDDENYRGVSWRGSAISEETFAIVRRWMQEGSVVGAGRGARGGRFGSRSAATFGWDQSSSSDPVDLSFLHRKRASLDERKGSGQRLSLDMPPAFVPVSATRTSMNGPAKPSRSRPVSMPVAPTQFRSTPKSNHKPSPLSVSTKALNGSMVTPKSSTPITPKTITTTAKPVEDDDEWGEMVSSPQTSTNTSGWGQSSTSIPDSGVDFAMSPTAKPASVSSPNGSARGSQSKPSVRFTEPTIPADTGSMTSSPLEKSFPSSPPSQPPPQSPVVGTSGIADISTSGDFDRLGGRKPVATASVTNNESSETEELTEAEEDAVARVVLSLPDLSYMLR